MLDNSYLTRPASTKQSFRNTVIHQTWIDFGTFCSRKKCLTREVPNIISNLIWPVTRQEGTIGATKDCISILCIADKSLKEILQELEHNENEKTEFERFMNSVVFFFYHLRDIEKKG